MKKALYSMAALAVILMSSTSIAQSSEKREERKEKMIEKFNETDTDKDGMISKAEAESNGLERVVAHFDEIDDNADGLLSKEEFRKAFEERRRKGRS